MLVWKDDYAVGVELIDEQHKQLFVIGNKIYDLLENYLLDDKYDKIVLIIEELKEYTKYHFQSEEQYMMQVKYSKLFSHKVEHDDFIAKIEETDFNAIDNNQEEFIRDLLLFVFNWISEHILQNDKLITTHNEA